MRRIWFFRLAIFCLVSVAGIAPTSAQDPFDGAVAAAIAAYNRLPNNPHALREVGRISDADGAIIFAEMIDGATRIVYPGVIEWLYVNRNAGVWTVTLPGTLTYRTAYRMLSQSLKDGMDAADRLVRTQAQPGLVAPAALLDYELPFPDGAYGTITRSYDAHGIGRIDFDLTAREVAAAKDGLIVYADDASTIQTYESGGWWYWNTVIIQHDDHQYSLYGHLAADSVPAWIRAGCPRETPRVPCAVPVRAGEVIGLEGNTGNSTNPHLHVEFGQGYGVVPYLDRLDGDNDGARDQVIYAGYVYGEHDVGLNGVAPDVVGAWGYLTVLEAVVGE